MSITEHERRNIFVKLEELVGRAVAENIMELLPLLPHSELATRKDLLALAGSLRGEMAQLRVEMRGEMAALRADISRDMAAFKADITGDIDDLGATVRGEIIGLRAELIDTDHRLTGQLTTLRGEITELGAEVRGEMRALEGRLQRWAGGILAANGVALIIALFL